MDAPPGAVPLYARSHFMLLPSSCSEGWPKVLSEAMAYGVVPVASNVSCIPQILGATGSELTSEPGDLDGFAATVVRLASDPRAVDAPPAAPPWLPRSRSRTTGMWRPSASCLRRWAFRPCALSKWRRCASRQAQLGSDDTLCRAKR